MIRFLPAIIFVIFVIFVIAAGAGCDGGTGSDDAAASGTATRAPDDARMPTQPSIEAALAAADDYFNTQELEKAELILDRLIERAPREGRAHEMMGQVLSLRAAGAAERGEAGIARSLRREAYAHYRTAAEIGPPSAGLEQSAGTIAMLAEEPEAALAHFEAASTLDPVNPQHPLYAAQLFIARDDRDAARSRLDRVLELDPDEPLAHASLAVIALEDGRVEDARARIAHARALAPHDVRFRVQEARILRRSGLAQQAVETLLALGEAAWRDEAVAAELAAGYDALARHHDAARVWMFRFGTGDPASSSYRDAARAGEALRRAGDLDEARHWLGEASMLAPDAPEVRALGAALDGG